jgi:hypothetical protein
MIRPVDESKVRKKLTIIHKNNVGIMYVFRRATHGFASVNLMAFGQTIMAFGPRIFKQSKEGVGALAAPR